jgi:hypothetical protein
MQANMPREAKEASNAVSSAMSKMESHSNQVSRRVGGHFKHIGEEAKKSAEKIVHSLAGAFDSIAEHAMHLSGIGGILGGIELRKQAQENLASTQIKGRAKSGAPLPYKGCSLIVSKVPPMKVY